MKRPQTAKPGYQGNWGQASVEDASQQSNIQRHQNRRQVKLMKPDLTTHDFARILPRKIQQDKERLYSEALQLKQSMNQLAEENIRMKTKISILEREKNKMNKFMETAPQSIGNIGSRINIYQSKSYEKENMIIRNLKKIVKESREENEVLKNQSLKIKKTMKYTKINEFQFERKIIFDENRRLNELLEEYSAQFDNQEQIQRENQELKGYLEQQLEQKQQMAEDKEKYQEIIESLEEQLKSSEYKYQNKQKKLLRDLNNQKRRVQQFQRKNNELAREVKSLKQAQQYKANSGPVKPLNRAPQINVRIGSSKVNTHQSQIPNELEKKLSEVNHHNQKLEKELSEVKAKLKKAEEEIYTLLQKGKIASRSNLNISQLEKNQQYQVFEKKEEPQQKNKQQNNNADEEQYKYDEEFDNEGKMKESKQEQEIQSLKKQFQLNDEEEELYKKEEVKKSNLGQKDKKKDKKANSKEAYKPNKKILAQIKELLTYRMKAQRYPFNDIKTDIESAQADTFSYQDLCNMFVNEPFYLTTEYTEIFLSYCFEKSNISPSDSLTKEILVSKLRKVVEDFNLFEEDQEKEMIVRIAEMTSTYPRELQAAFENIKNGEETVGRQDLIQMFKKLELQDRYIELIIAELSLCSDDLEHLNFLAFFQRFYIQDENDNYVDNTIQEQDSEESYKNSSRIKKKPTKAKQHASEDEHQQII